jgi:hypothetical protein
MKLSDELFAEICEAVASERAALNQPQQSERRTSGRARADLDVTIEPYGVARGVPRTARLKDFSVTGVRVYDTRCARTGDQFIIHLPRKCGAVPLVCTVRNCRVRTDGTFSLGAEFTSNAEKSRSCRPVVSGVEGIGSRETDLELLRGRYQQTQVQQHGDKRGSQRIDTARPVRIISYDGGRCGALCEAEVRDTSRTGACLLYREAMEKGKQFLVQPLDEQGPQWKLYKVTSCRTTDDGRFRIGAKLECAMHAVGSGGLRAKVRNWFRPRSGKAAPAVEA